MPVSSAVRAIFLATLFLFPMGMLFAQDPKPGDAKPVEAKAAEAKPADAKPAEPPPPAWKADVDTARDTALGAADTSWMLVSTGLVMFMMPGLALFYGGMVRRKNVLGTMMHTMICLGLVGVQWVVIGYSLAFGQSKEGYIGFSPELICLSVDAAVGKSDDDVKKANPSLDEEALKKEIKKVNRFKVFPATKVPLYLHAMFQGMFAIITVALVSGAFAERVKFFSYCLFALLWTTLVYDPLAHWVWSFDWESGKAVGILGKDGALDFAGGTVVHIAAGVSGLAAVLLLRKRNGYGKHPIHPNNIVLTLLGAGMLWFGWFGFNGGSALASNALAISALTVTQIAAATAGLAWVIVEWLHRGKPTALGFASGLVAGLVAITPASGFVAPIGALVIGALSGVICYWAVAAKSKLGYDDSLDAFGIHGIGGMLGAILTGVFVSIPLWTYGAGIPETDFVGVTVGPDGAKKWDMMGQIYMQCKAVLYAAVYAFVVTSILVLLIDWTIGFTTTAKDEAQGLDLSQHGEVGVDVGPEVDGGGLLEPKAATAPPVTANGKRFTVAVAGANEQQLMKVWSKLCQASENPPSKEFRAVYPYLTTVTGTKFRFRGGDPVVMKASLQKLFNEALNTTTVTTSVES
jgi:ammonium transporter, Amt family